MIQKAKEVVKEVRIVPRIIFYLYVILQVEIIVSSNHGVNILTKEWTSNEIKCVVIKFGGYMT